MLSLQEKTEATSDLVPYIVAIEIRKVQQGHWNGMTLVFLIKIEDWDI